uniref:hypothetical protein n=1 Tax=Sandaracinus sp. TaxID=2024858 RepID=UPI0019D48CEA|nr:hypothetical protein [Sandaracinus sp.]
MDVLISTRRALEADLALALPWVAFPDVARPRDGRRGRAVAGEGAAALVMAARVRTVRGRAPHHRRGCSVSVLVLGATGIVGGEVRALAMRGAGVRWCDRPSVRRRCSRGRRAGARRRVD